MTRPTSDELAEYVLGILPEPRRSALAAELAMSAELARELQAVREALGELPAKLAHESAPLKGRGALLAALDSAARYSPFVDDLAEHLDLPSARILELLLRTDDRSAWQASEFPGIQQIDFPAGSAAIAEHAGFVSFPKGLHFPYHRHLGPELNYVLHGSLQTDDGQLYVAGDALLMTTGSVHAFSFPHEDTMIAVVHQEFEFVQAPAR